jgi:undecaprenyl-diphosphatase
VPLLVVVIILGLIEGLTEFIPVSSTGHLILGNALFGFEQMLGQHEKAALFDVFIQLGAILAVGFIYRDKLIGVGTRSLVENGPDRRLLISMIIGFVPAAGVGFLAHDFIEEHLFTSVNVAWAFIVGGIIILVIERLPIARTTCDTSQITVRQALAVGVAQVLSLFPGTSRSGATIMGGLCAGLDRRTATEFSFLLSFPIMVAASAFVLVKHIGLIDWEMAYALVAGFLVSFVSAWLVVKWLIRFVQRHSFVAFAWYRIAFGILILAWAFAHR